MRKTKIKRWLHRYATFVAFATFLLIIAGALVTSTDAGLSVPDWPTSFGSFHIPRMVGGVKYEHGHRMLAGTVVILTVILSLWLWRSEERRRVRRLGGLAILTIIAQAALGGITVLYFLPVDISVMHACLAQLFFCITVSIALFTSPKWRWDRPRLEDQSTPSLRHLSVATTVLIFVQLLLGAAFRHHGFGISPHILVAALVTACIFWLLFRVLAAFRHESQLERAAFLLAGLLVMQIFLGIGSFLMLLATQGLPRPSSMVVTLTTAHVAVGALLLASSLYLTCKIYWYLAPPLTARVEHISVNEARP
ncbi:MAG TPA: COX15/CtaA family protein [Candidatus Sulfotelmatobacter sp.]|nr:COX15/CtaA family protein [Candidatus Sulfotelmatobacter sp.]